MCVWGGCVCVWGCVCTLCVCVCVCIRVFMSVCLCVARPHVQANQPLFLRDGLKDTGANSSSFCCFQKAGIIIYRWTRACTGNRCNDSTHYPPKRLERKRNKMTCLMPLGTSLILLVELSMKQLMSVCILTQASCSRSEKLCRTWEQHHVHDAVTCVMKQEPYGGL